MNPADQFLDGFAKTWRGAQRRLWDGSSHDANAADLVRLEHAWHESCQQWWENLRHVVPQSLLNPLASALRQTQLCMALALRGEQLTAADLALMMHPLVGMRPIELSREQNATARTGSTDHAQLLAGRAIMTSIATITQSALAAAREQLNDGRERTPRELYVQSAKILESCYRDQAGSDEFTQLVARWVDAHVSVLASRRRRAAGSAASSVARTDHDPAARSGFSSAHPGSRPAHDHEARDNTAAVAAAQPPGGQLAQQMCVFIDKLAAGASSLAALPAAGSRGGVAHEVVLQCDGVRLLRYRGASRDLAPAPNSAAASPLPPLLIVYSLVNRPYVLDLNEDRSLIRTLCHSGRDVYVIDWGYPREQDAGLGLDDYLNRYLHRCVTYLQDRCDADAVDLIGICQGGPFALCYTALEPSRVRRLVLMAAPFDFHTDDFLLARWLRAVDVDALVSVLGNVPGHLLNWGFIALKPVSVSGLKTLDLLDLLDRPRELATYAEMEHWLQDNPDQAGKAFAEFTRIFVKDNGLVNASARIGPRLVDLRAVRHRVLNIYGIRDHIVPPSASRALSDLLINAQCTNRAVDCGHIGVFAGRRTQSEVPTLVNDWFEQAD